MKKLFSKLWAGLKRFGLWLKSWIVKIEPQVATAVANAPASVESGASWLDSLTAALTRFGKSIATLGPWLKLAKALIVLVSLLGTWVTAHREGAKPIAGLEQELADQKENAVDAAKQILGLKGNLQTVQKALDDAKASCGPAKAATAGGKSVKKKASAPAKAWYDLTQ